MFLFFRLFGTFDGELFSWSLGQDLRKRSYIHAELDSKRTRITVDEARTNSNGETWDYHAVLQHRKIYSSLTDGFSVSQADAYGRSQFTSSLFLQQKPLGGAFPMASHLPWTSIRDGFQAC